MLIATDLPLLAARIGAYREWAVTGPLAQYFCCHWSHLLPDEFKGRVAVVPDGCSDIIWTGEQLVVVGPDRTAAFPQLRSGANLVGLRFRPGAALAWLNTPLSELVGRTIPLSTLWGSEAEAIETRLMETSAAEQSKLLRTLLAAHKSGNPADDLLALFTRLSGGGRGANLQTFIGEVAYGERTLRRRGLDHFGYGSKSLERILRFQRFLRLTRHLHRGNLAGLALNAGYADQAHMNREVKALTTLTPLQIHNQLSAD